jgi:hypothetical protein
MTSCSPGSPEPRDLPERVVTIQPDNDLPVVRYRVLLHDRQPLPGTTRARGGADASSDQDTARPGRGPVWRSIATRLAGDPPITASMAALALMVVLCYGAIKVATVGTAAGVVVFAVGASVIATLYLLGRE